MPRDPSQPTTLTVDEARQRVLAKFTPLEPVTVPLDDALGLILAEDIAARSDLPPFDNSAMDGFAVRSADTDGAPVTLRVTATIAAGRAGTHRVEPGRAVRIMTGAPIPVGADAVVRVEATETAFDASGREVLTLQRPVRSGENVRPAGEDAREGASVLRRGQRIQPGAIGLLAATGHVGVAVYRRPRVGVLVSGDEVVAPGKALGPGQIWNSNGPMVAAQVRQCGGQAVVLGTAADSAGAVRAKLAEIDGLDLLVTTGGVSVGDFDVVKDVLREEGQITLWSLRIKPGKPLAFGTLGDTPVIGLPGNPVAAAVAFGQFAHPAVRTMLGYPEVRLPEIEARLLDRVENRGGRRQFVRVHVEQDQQGYTARLAGGQGSAMLTSLAASNGLLVVPETCEAAEPGDLMTVQMPGWDLGQLATMRLVDRA